MSYPTGPYLVEPDLSDARNPVRIMASDQQPQQMRTVPVSVPTEDLNALVDDIATWGVEYKGHLYRGQDSFSGAWCYDATGFYFLITINVPAPDQAPLDLR